MSMSMASFLIYGLVEPETGQLRYVGKSCSGLTRPKEHFYPSRFKSRTHKACWMRGLLAKGLTPEIVVLQECSDSDVLSQAEQFWVSYFRAMGCSLTNLTNGGKGSLGHAHSAETKRKQSVALQGYKYSEASSLKKARTLGGRPFQDQNGNRYETIRGAARLLGLNRSSLNEVLKGRRQTVGGYAFSYISDAKEIAMTSP